MIIICGTLRYFDHDHWLSLSYSSSHTSLPASRRTSLLLLHVSVSRRQLLTLIDCRTRIALDKSERQARTVSGLSLLLILGLTDLSYHRYNCGHLLEGALAHYKCFKNDHFLEPMIKYINLLCKVFGTGPGQIKGYPGHEEIELALLRLYRITHDPEHLRLARFFLDERGRHEGDGKQLYYELEAKRRAETALPPHLQLNNPLSYYQADKPLVEQTSVEGHSVRCMYLLTGAADLCIIEPKSKERYFPVLKRLWDNMVQKKMYLTGGIGAKAEFEGFGVDHWLPQSSDEGGCYAETCAAIGVIMLAERLLQVSSYLVLS